MTEWKYVDENNLEFYNIFVPILCDDFIWSVHRLLIVVIWSVNLKNFLEKITRVNLIYNFS